MLVRRASYVIKYVIKITSSLLLNAANNSDTRLPYACRVSASLLPLVFLKCCFLITRIAFFHEELWLNDILVTCSAAHVEFKEKDQSQLFPQHVDWCLVDGVLLWTLFTHQISKRGSRLQLASGGEKRASSFGCIWVFEERIWPKCPNRWCRFENNNSFWKFLWLLNIIIYNLYLSHILC